MNLSEREERQQQFEEELEDRQIEEAQKKFLQMLKASGVDENDPRYADLVDATMRELAWIIR